MMITYLSLEHPCTESKFDHLSDCALSAWSF